MLYLDNMQVVKLYAHLDSLEKAIFLLLAYLKNIQICMVIGGVAIEINSRDLTRLSISTTC